MVTTYYITFNVVRREAGRFPLVVIGSGNNILDLPIEQLTCDKKSGPTLYTYIIRIFHNMILPAYR